MDRETSSPHLRIPASSHERHDLVLRGPASVRFIKLHQHFGVAVSAQDRSVGSQYGTCHHRNLDLTCTNWSGVAELRFSKIQFCGIFVISASDRMTHQARTYTARDNPSADSDDPPHAIESAILLSLG